MNLKILRYYQSWKDLKNNKLTIIPKNIKNDNSTFIKDYVPWNDSCAVKKYKFHANPIKHYRKQYTNINSSVSTFSRSSMIGILDRPGGTINSLIDENDCDSINNNLNHNIITHFNTLNDCKNNSSDRYEDPITKKIYCTSLNPAALVIKTATTVLSQNYSSSHREYLYNKCKTFNQNLPSQNDIAINNGTRTINCNDITTCVTFNPSNKTFQTQGPVSSSARTHSLKYGCIDGVSCNRRVSINNCPSNLSLHECASLKKLLNNPSSVCVGCINDPASIRRKRIKILR